MPLGRSPLGKILVVLRLGFVVILEGFFPKVEKVVAAWGACFDWFMIVLPFACRCACAKEAPSEAFVFSVVLGSLDVGF